MGAHSYEDLVAHLGHDLEVADYAGSNAAIECLTCSTVLVDFEATVQA